MGNDEENGSSFKSIKIFAINNADKTYIDSFIRNRYLSNENRQELDKIFRSVNEFHLAIAQEKQMRLWEDREPWHKSSKKKKKAMDKKSVLIRHRY